MTDDWQGTAVIDRLTLESYLADYLRISEFRDYCPNGLQVEGRQEIRRLFTGVTASQAVLDVAAQSGADALLVHHGYFWRGEDGRITGIRRRRIGTLLAHEINLLAYHLPLDAHAEIGNNVMLAKALGITVDGRFGEQNLGMLGSLPGIPVTELAGRLAQACGREPLLLGGEGQVVRRVAWCTGAAQGFFEQAIALGVDAYISGEVSEYNTHLALESGVAYIAAGHHATERFGVGALGEHLAARFGITHRFVDVDNPV